MAKSRQNTNCSNTTPGEEYDKKNPHVFQIAQLQSSLLKQASVMHSSVDSSKKTSNPRGKMQTKHELSNTFVA